MDCIISAHTEVLANMNDSNTASDFLFSLVPHLQLYLPYIANLTNALTTLNDLRDRGVFFDTTKGVVSVQSIENLLERPKQHLADYPATIAVCFLFLFYFFFFHFNVNVIIYIGING